MSSLAVPFDGLPDQVARRLVSLATRAPSVHNTQPWVWHLHGDRIDLCADDSRRLEATDPQGRELVMSCGAALHHLRVAAGASGLRPDVTRLPDPDRPDLLATIRFSSAPRPPTSAADLRAIHDRCTDRRRFTSWPIPDDRLRLLTQAVKDDGGDAVALTDVTDRFRVELMAAQAHRVQQRDTAIAAEAKRWVDRGAYDGLAPDHLPARAGIADTLPNRFTDGLLPDDDRELETADGLIVLCGNDDTRSCWLRAGESLSVLWLKAVQGGLSVVPLSQVVEVTETRAAMQHQVLNDLAVPMLLVRVGWQAISRSQLEATPRRPLDDVLNT